MYSVAVSSECLQVIQYQNRESWLKLNRKCFWLWLAQHCSLSRKLLSLFTGYFACKPVKKRQIDQKMAQGSFASRIFHKYCKNSQEHRGPDSELPHISEFTTMWEKLSKFSVLPLRIKHVGHLLQLRTVSVCTRVYGTENDICFDQMFTYCSNKSLISCPVLWH